MTSSAVATNREKTADLLLSPDKWTLDIRKPEAAFFVNVVQESHDLSDRLLLILHLVPIPSQLR
jgi:hypothetical protein